MQCGAGGAEGSGTGGPAVPVCSATCQMRAHLLSAFSRSYRSLGFFPPLCIPTQLHLAFLLPLRRSTSSPYEDASVNTPGEFTSLAPHANTFRVYVPGPRYKPFETETNRNPTAALSGHAWKAGRPGPAPGCAPTRGALTAPGARAARNGTQPQRAR